MKIYVASSWRNAQQPDVVAALAKAGHELYDFRNPAPGNTGFHWSEIDPQWQSWNGEQFAAALQHPVAESGFGFDKAALDWCDACVLVLASGRSAHLEAGYAIGKGKPTAILLTDQQEPELMYKLADACLLSIEAVVAWANHNDRDEFSGNVIEIIGDATDDGQKSFDNMLSATFKITREAGPGHSLGVWLRKDGRAEIVPDWVVSERKRRQRERGEES